MPRPSAPHDPNTLGASLPAISLDIWERKYRLKAADGTPIDATLADTWRRVAEAAASPEPKRRRARIADRFAEAMSDLAFLPAGRIIAGAGTGRAVTLFNCFVMGRIEDDLSAIFENVREAALTMQQGGGIGHDFSTLRPAGALVRSISADASGPVSFMDVWDAMCRTIMSAGSRRGAMMATLRCDHPDIETFIAAKADPARLRNFNLSVLVTDAFLAAVRGDRPWPLQFEGRVYRTVAARALWQRLMRATYDYAEPGVIFIDRINRENNLAYCEEIHATNPCGEEPLPPYGACLLGSINLARLVARPFTAAAAIDTARLEELTATAVRCLDNVIDISNYPLEAQRREAKAKRRIGLGVTGLADALILCGLRYGSSEALVQAERWMATIQRAAYLASAELGSEKGAFPLFDAARFLAAPGVVRLGPDVAAAIARHGIRNGCLTSIAPTGTISLLAGNVSSGVEPVFDFRYRRRILNRDGTTTETEVEDYAHRLHRESCGERAPPGHAFVTATELSPRMHLEMQAALQRHVDSAISKTINCPADMPFEAFESVYLEANELGLKGCTTYRPNAVTGAVLRPMAEAGGDARETAEPSAAGGPAPPTPLAPFVATLPALAAGPVSMAREVAARDPATLAPGLAGPTAGVVYMAKPLEREPALAGFTYKLKWPVSDHALYITLNDIEQDGRRRPFEIFINTKNLEHYAWTVALTRMISAVFRRGGDVAFVVEELKAVFDPQGGQWMGGRYVPSLLAAIGEVIEAHMVRIGFLAGTERADPPADRTAARAMAMAGAGIEPASQLADPEVARDRAPAAGPAGLVPRSATGRAARACPRCSRSALVRREGCWICDECGYSKCG